MEDKITFYKGHFTGFIVSYLSTPSDFYSILSITRKNVLTLMVVVMIATGCSVTDNPSQGKSMSIAERRQSERSDNKDHEKKIDALLGQVTQLNNSTIVTESN